MNPSCPNCHHVYEKEQGFFVSAIYMNYLLTSFTVLPVVLVSLFVFETEFPKVLLLPMILVLILNPIYQYVSRMVLVFVDSKRTSKTSFWFSDE
jgi:hypothetical protein